MVLVQSQYAQSPVSILAGRPARKDHSEEQKKNIKKKSISVPGLIVVLALLFSMQPPVWSFILIGPLTSRAISAVLR